MGFWAVVGGAIAWRCYRLLIIGISIVVSVIILFYSCLILLNVGGWVSLIAPVACLLLTNGTVFYTFLFTRLVVSCHF
jgi:CHASE2 domain-containing sensor protein